MSKQNRTPRVDRTWLAELDACVNRHPAGRHRRTGRTVSRWGHARLMDAIAVSMLIALCAALGVIVWAASI